MSEAKFTKGPWEYDYRMIEVLADNRTKPVCFGVTDDNDGYLIAAAPEMYEAMQEFVNRVDRGEVRSTATYNKFKTILAKARGEL